MTVRRVALVVVICLCCSDAAVAVSHATSPVNESASTPNATLVEAYPNPVARGDPGEFVAVRFEAPTNTTGWTITDGKTTARLPNRTVDGTVAFSMTPDDAIEHTSHPVEDLDGRLLLADGGETIKLRRDGERVDTATYRNAPVSRIRDFEAGAWRPVGATGFDPVRTDGGDATAFVLPDAPEATVDAISDADERLFVAGYELTDERVVDALLDARARGAEVRVLLDGSPVGGMSERQARLLDRLADSGVDVRLLSGPHLRYQHHHPKYAVADDRALVLTENFKPAGTGGKSSRGWGVALDDQSAADALAAVYEADADWRDAESWTTFRDGRDFQPADPALGRFETTHPPERVTVESATVLVTPDNAVEALERRIETADERVLIQQVDIDSAENSLLQAAIRAASRGVDVRVHLTGAWHSADENDRLAAWLNRYAEAEALPLEARVDEPSGYDSIHTKGVIVDDTVVVGSLNWRASSKAENREVLVALEGASVASYYAAVFEHDWTTEDGEEHSVPAGLVGGVAVAIAGGLLVARRVDLVGRDEVITDWKW